MESNIHGLSQRGEIVPPLAVSVDDACRLIGMKKSYLYQKMAEGALVSRKVGARRLIDYASLRQWWEAQPVVA